MPTYRVQCVSQGGRFFSRVFDAPNLPALRASVEARGAFALHVRELRANTGSRRIRLSLGTLVSLLDLLAMQLAAGVSTELAVAKLKDEFPNRAARSILRGVHTELTSSTASLSGALAKYPRSFPEGIIAAIRVGEESGGAGLAARLADVRDQIAFRIAVRKTAVRALAYPLFILCFASAVVALLMVKLVPNLKVLLDSLNTPLPDITRSVLATSSFVQSYWYLGLIGIVGVGIAFRVLRSIPATAVAIDRLLLRIPFLGGIFKALVTAEVAKNYRALYNAGADAGTTLAACAGVVRNRALKNALFRSRSLLESGVVTAGNPDLPPITEALRATGYFPELALTIIGTGEASGSLASALESVARHYAASAQERVQTFFGVFDKVVMLGLILSMGAIVIGLWMPIMTAAEHMH